MLSIAANQVRGLPRAYWFLWVGTLINRLGTFVVPFLSFYLTQERGFSIEQAGLTATAYGVGSLCAGPLGGALADRVGRRATMGLGLFGGAAAMIHLGLARSPGHVLLASALLGLIGDTYRPAVWAAVADVVPPADRLRAYGHLYWAINLGFAASSMVAGALAAGGFWLLFAGDALTSVAMGLVVMGFVAESRPAEAAARARQGLSAFATPFGDGVFLSFVALAFLLCLMFMQHTVALPLDMKAHGIGASQFGALIAINGVLIVLLQPFLSRAVAGRPRARVLALAAVLVGTGFGLPAALGPTVPAYALGIAIWTLGEILLSPVTPTVVADLAPTALRGTYQGVHQMAWGAASVVAPIIGSLALSRVGARALWVGCFAAGLLVAAGHFAIAGARRRRIAELGLPARD